MTEDMGASASQTGLAGAEAPEPHTRLGPSDGIPSAERRRIADSQLGIHEALHTASVLIDAFCTHVAEHPAVAERPEIAKLAETAAEAMCDVYQALGRVSDTHR